MSDLRPAGLARPLPALVRALVPVAAGTAAAAAAGAAMERGEGPRLDCLGGGAAAGVGVGAPRLVRRAEGSPPLLGRRARSSGSSSWASGGVSSSPAPDSRSVCSAWLGSGLGVRARGQG